MSRENHIDNLKTRIDYLKAALRRDDYEKSILRMYDKDELESLEWAVSEFEGVEYEYTCETIYPDGAALRFYTWSDDLELVKQTLERNTKDNSEDEAKNGKNGLTFRVVRRRKAGPAEVVE